MKNLIPFIYPGAIIQIGDFAPITVSMFDYRFSINNSLDVVIYDGDEEFRLSNEGIEITCGDNKVRCITDSHDKLAQLFNCLDQFLFRCLMSFLRGDKFLSKPHMYTRDEFDLKLDKQCKTFAYFLDSNPLDIFISHVEKYFDATSHNTDCTKYKTGITFDDEHVCDTTGHIRVLINLTSNKSIHKTRNNCLGAVEIIRGSPQYIHITPAGSLIIGTYGQGCCRHPLTRVIFWTVMLKSHPELIPLFTHSYLCPLITDLKFHNFINHTDYSSLQDVIKDFNLDSCLFCRRSFSKVRSWGSSTYDYNFCGHINYYNYHLLLLAVLRNGWEGDSLSGSTTLDFCGLTFKVNFDSGNILSFGPDSNFEYCYYIRSSFSSFLQLVLPLTHL